MLIYKFYPHHYTPFINNITNFKNIKIKFKIKSPFLPFQQLITILPTTNKKLLPKPYQINLSNTNINFYNKIYPSTYIITQKTSSQKQILIILNL